MASVNSTLVLTDKMTATFQSVERAAKQAEQTFQRISDKLDEMDNKSKKVSSSGSSIFKGMLGANLVSKGISMVVGQLDTAIKRFDTINNYERVMSNLGFDAENSAASIERLKDGLDGLPTTLQDGVTAVQRFAASNENIAASTEMYLALNDAILAGGAAQAAQDAALEQVTQAYSKGKFEANEWKTMLIAMPAQLKAVAQAMGYTSTAVGGDFYNAVQSGKVSMNEMMKTMVELDHQTNGFHDQAIAATDGIGTAYTNMKTAITKGVADMIDSINTSLKNSGLPTIQEMIQKTGKAIQNTLVNVGKVVGSVVSFIGNNLYWLMPIFGTILGLLLLYKTYTLAAAIANGVLTAYQWLYNAALYGCPLVWIIGLIIVFIGLIYLVVGAINNATGSTISATGIVLAMITTAIAIIWNLFLGILDFVLIIISELVNAFIVFGNFLANVFVDPIGSIIHLFEGLLNAVLGILKSIAGAIDKVFGSNLAGAINNWQSGISSKANELAEKFGNGKSGENRRLNLTSESLGLKRWSYTDAASTGYNAGANFGKGAAKINPSAGMPNIDWNSLTAPAGSGGAGNSGGSGGKAVKTTSTDKNLLSDEDMQLLLDVATRDYKLNYQQVTPQITLTFGDIRETADVDNILDQVADRLEEIYDSNLEVAT